MLDFATSGTRMAMVDSVVGEPVDSYVPTPVFGQLITVTTATAAVEDAEWNGDYFIKLYSAV